MALKDTWKPRVDGVDDADSSAVNEIAQAVIDIEKNGTGGDAIEIDTEMSDTSTNAVQNKVIKTYVDNMVGDIGTALDDIIAEQEAIIAVQNSLIGGESV